MRERIMRQEEKRRSPPLLMNAINAKISKTHAAQQMEQTTAGQEPWI
jgi:hypothetical protein